MKILGILNITEDSFSDGGKYLEPAAALAHARDLSKDADILDIGAASSNPDSASVSAKIEIARLENIVPTLREKGVPLSIDTFTPEVQRWALEQNVGYLNDIHGFPNAALYPELAGSSAKLIVMHAIQREGRATRTDVPPSEIRGRIHRFFDTRLNALVKAGIARERLIVDPGMGFFLGSDPETSFAVLRALPELKRAFGLPVLISVSRKSFLRKITGRPPAESGPASLAAELFAALQGADLIRTHDPKALRDGLVLWRELAGNKL
ncbi:MAG TPA: dihydropteroate synthase [Rhizomicrobium sp.]